MVDSADSNGFWYAPYKPIRTRGALTPLCCYCGSSTIVNDVAAFGVIVTQSFAAPLTLLK